MNVMIVGARTREFLAEPHPQRQGCHHEFSLQASFNVQEHRLCMEKALGLIPGTLWTPKLHREEH